MSFVLEIKTGIDAGKSIGLPKGQPVRVGRSDEVEFVIPNDPTLSRVHFSLEWTGSTVLVRDLGSRFGTQLDGSQVTTGTVRNGSVIRAGESMFTVHEVRSSATTAPLPHQGSSTPQVSATQATVVSVQPKELLGLLRALPEPLFALLDAARDPSIPSYLKASGEKYQSLYEGTKGDELAEFAPYLVSLPKDSPFLEKLVKDGWGKSWGIYLTSSETFNAVRKHFRHFLLVKTEDGRDLYFRFYDPRVLRIYLPTCNSEEAKTFFGSIRGFLIEGTDDKTLMKFTTAEYGIANEGQS